MQLECRTGIFTLLILHMRHNYTGVPKPTFTAIEAASSLKEVGPALLGK
jgi:hypothetical protein